MIELNRHIEILLLSNDCVIVPNLGGFVAHHIDARYDSTDGVFLPPLRTLGFNPSLKLNDHLLVQSYIEAYDISYPEALRRIDNEVEELKQHLENEGHYELFDLGTLSINDEGNYQFTPCESGILTPALYGLTLFEMAPLDTSQPNGDATVTEDNGKDDNEKESIVTHITWPRKVAAIAAAVLMCFLISTPTNNSKGYAVQEGCIFHVTTTPSTTEDSVKEASIPQASDTIITVATAMKEETVEEPRKEVEAKNSYTIVLASQTTQLHAEDFIKNLQRDGIGNVHIVEMNGTKKVRVTYGSYPSEEEARDSLRVLRSSNNSVFKDAWVLNIK